MALQGARAQSIKWRITIPMVVLVVLQAVLFSGTVLFGGVLQQLNHNSFMLLEQRTNNRAHYIESEMNTRWGGISSAVGQLECSIGSFMEEQGISAEQLSADSVQADRLLEQMTPLLIELLRKNSPTGAFLILDGDERDLHNQRKAAVYLRDLEPATADPANADLLLACASVSLVQKLNIPLDSLWVPDLTLDREGGLEKADFYYKPLDAARAYPKIESKDLGYWSMPFRVHPRGRQILTYSLPLRDQQGKVIGVAGVDLTVEHLRGAMPYDELSEFKDGTYLLGVSRDTGKSFEVVVSNGPVFGQLYDQVKQIGVLLETAYPSCYQLEDGRNGQQVYAAITPMTLYNSNTPFEGDRWALVGILERHSLLGAADQIRGKLLAALVICLVASLTGVLFIVRAVTKPIHLLTEQIRVIKPSDAIRLVKTNIGEIDELAAVTEQLSTRVAASASRLTQIIDMAGLPIGAFEYLRGEEDLSIIGPLFQLLNIEPVQAGDQVSTKWFEDEMGKLKNFVVGRVQEQYTEYIFSFQRQNGNTAWVSLQVMDEPGRSLGVVRDITRETLEKQRIERERDYDALTDLYNRRAFNERFFELFEKPSELQVAAFVMIDLDNLKYVNDTYGHDVGDAYIRSAANIISRSVPINTLIARMAGDEFYVFYYGYTSRAQVEELINRLDQGFLDSCFPLPGGEPIQIRSSGGIAWYPDDTTDRHQLMKFADYAMYQIKHGAKGAFSMFDAARHAVDINIHTEWDPLSQMLEKQLVEYHYQPILEASTGTVFGWEALMRPTMPALSNPTEVLNLARSRGMLQQIEQLTCFNSMAGYVDRGDLLSGQRIFLHSVGSQILTPGDVQELKRYFAPYLHLLVIQLSEGERIDLACTAHKRELAYEWNACLALSSFGISYNSADELAAVRPAFVKLSATLTSQIDMDPVRQERIRALCAVAKEKNARVIAQGIETRGELETMIRLGAEFVQGHLIGMPVFSPRATEVQTGEIVCGIYRKYQALANTEPKE